MAETLVMLPGMMCDARLFAAQTSEFEQQGHPVLVPPLDGADTVQRLAGEILEELPPRFALAGLSMGGIVAMEMVRQGAGRITRLALMDTNPHPEGKERHAVRKEQIRKVESGKLREVIRDEMKPNYLADGPGREDILDLCMEMALALGDDVFIRQSRALAGRPDQMETLKAVRVPTLILHGSEDTLCPAPYHEDMAGAVKGSRLEVVGNAGHLTTLEQPEATTALLKEWLGA